MRGALKAVIGGKKRYGIITIKKTPMHFCIGVFFMSLRPYLLSHLSWVSFNQICATFSKDVLSGRVNLSGIHCLVTSFQRWNENSGNLSPSRQLNTMAICPIDKIFVIIKVVFFLACLLPPVTRR